MRASATPADSKLLIINADDLAMSHSENDATFTALDQKLVTSVTVMVPVRGSVKLPRTPESITTPTWVCI